MNELIIYYLFCFFHGQSKQHGLIFPLVILVFEFVIYIRYTYLIFIWTLIEIVFICPKDCYLDSVYLDSRLLSGYSSSLSGCNLSDWYLGYILASSRYIWPFSYQGYVDKYMKKIRYIWLFLDNIQIIPRFLEWAANCANTHEWVYTPIL